jgi:NAD+ synthase
MPEKLSIALAQLNPVMGDIGGNAAKLATTRAACMDADLLVTSELYLCGYPPEDLVLKPSFLDAVRAAIEALARFTAGAGPAILVGAPWFENGHLYNAMLLLAGGQVAAKAFKHDLPNYGPFDEKRVFAAGSLPKPMMYRGVSIGVPICEDVWTAESCAHLKKFGAEILIVPNGSPFETGKTARRHMLAAARVAETGLPFIYLNQFGGQDELVFDGASFGLDAGGKEVLTMPTWREAVGRVTYENGVLSQPDPVVPEARDSITCMYHALMTGLRDYVVKNGFAGVVLGLSGGIDSALAAVLAVDALGAEKVRGVMLPSPYTSSESTEDAEILARSLGIRLDCVPIADAMTTFDAVLRPVIGAQIEGVTQENIQSRSRGLILMALSNATGLMVLSTGNKSEMSVGYATLYGDMCGGFAVLKDVYKTEVYNLSHWRNAHRPATALGPTGAVIPERTITKAPTAELRPNQTDQDSLPPYDVLDGILECLIEQDAGLKEITAMGYDAAVAERVWGMLNRAEYKRRQAAPGVKITRRNLSRDRRYPITNKYCENRG